MIYCKYLEHGIPETIYSDNGSHFVNEVIRLIAQHLGITLTTSLFISPTKDMVRLCRIS